MATPTTTEVRIVLKNEKWKSYYLKKKTFDLLAGYGGSGYNNPGYNAGGNSNYGGSELIVLIF
jgi:hypothetical protein